MLAHSITLWAARSAEVAGSTDMSRLSTSKTLAVSANRRSLVPRPQTPPTTFNAHARPGTCALKFVGGARVWGLDTRLDIRGGPTGSDVTYNN